MNASLTLAALHWRVDSEIDRHGGTPHVLILRQQAVDAEMHSCFVRLAL